MASTELEIVEKGPIKTRKLVAVTGFAGPGFIGSKAIMHIVRSKNLDEIAYINSELLPPMLVMIEGKISQSFRIYHNPPNNMLLITNDVPITSETSWIIAKKLVDWLVSKGVEKVISIEGMASGSISKERVVLGFSVPEMNLSNYGVLSTAEGVLYGLSAAMLKECIKRNVSWISLLVPTNRISLIDFGGVIAAINILTKMLQLDVEVESLKNREKTLQKRVKSQSESSKFGGISKFIRKLF